MYWQASIIESKSVSPVLPNPICLVPSPKHLLVQSHYSCVQINKKLVASPTHPHNMPLSLLGIMTPMLIKLVLCCKMISLITYVTR